jgi:hypothetical protein
MPKSHHTTKTIVDEAVKRMASTSKFNNRRFAKVANQVLEVLVEKLTHKIEPVNITNAFTLRPKVQYSPPSLPYSDGKSHPYLAIEVTVAVAMKAQIREQFNQPTQL